MLSMAELEAKKQIQDKSLVFWTLGLPLIFIIGFMTIFTDGTTDTATLASQIIPGFNVFFSFFIIISIVFSFVKDRDKGLVARLASTNITTTQFFIGKCIPFIMIVFAQLIILTVMGIFGYNMPLEHPVIYSLIILFLAIMVTLWGAAISVFSKTENYGLVMTQLIAFGGAVFGGLWFPFETLPTIIQTIGKVFPQYWVHQSLISTSTGDFNTKIIVVSFIFLIIYSLVGLFIALLGYKKFLKEAKN